MADPSNSRHNSDSRHEASENLIRQAQEGSREALGELIGQCRAYLLLVANSELDRQLQAKVAPSDVVQETLLRAHEHFAQFQGSSEKEFLAWVRRILLNQVVNVGRDLRRAKRDVNREQPIAGNSRVSIPAIDPATGDPTPSRQVSAQEDSRELSAAIERLPEDYRLAVLLRYQQDLSFAEMGKILDRSEDAARKLWYRAVERLQREMDATDGTR
jgi:RNA polymerase sigma-70 factor (ECF subfamily)